MFLGDRATLVPQRHKKLWRGTGLRRARYTLCLTTGGRTALLLQAKLKLDEELSIAKAAKEEHSQLVASLLEREKSSEEVSVSSFPPDSAFYS